MNPDDFEARLKEQPLRPVPPGWRSQILAQAEAASASAAAPFESAVQPWWRELLWPSPRAWAGLAAAWVLIATLRMGSLETASEPPAKRGPFSAQSVMALEQDIQLRAAWLNTDAMAERARQKTVPGPRSESALETISG